jgi:hypothetical protein
VGGPAAARDAPPQVALEATLTAGGRAVVGTLRGPPGLRLHPTLPLCSLPTPTDDQLIRWTFPVRVEAASCRLESVAPGVWRFEALFPRRTDAAGWVPGEGLTAAGLWHPQPLDAAGRPAVVDWAAVVRSDAPGDVLVLNRSVGRGEARWSGPAERLVLASRPRGRVQTPALPAGHLVLVDQGPRRPRRDARLEALLVDGWPGPGAPDLVVLEADARRRLARPGPGVLVLSERAFRLTGPLWVQHQPAVLRGLIESGLPVADPHSRALAAAPLAAAAVQAPDLRARLGPVAWIPQVDALLYDGRVPFSAEVFGEPWPGDRVADDLAELLSPDLPGPVYAGQLAAMHGDAAVLALARALAAGARPAEAFAAAGLPAPGPWPALPPVADLSLRLAPAPGGASLTVRRDGPPTLPPAPIVVEVDGARTVWSAPAGPAEVTLPLAAVPSAVRLDPGGLERQDRRDNDRAPVRWTVVGAFFPSQLRVRGGGFSAEASLVLRQAWNTRGYWDLSASTDPEDRLALSASRVHAWGPLQDRRSRPFRAWAGLGPSWLDPSFRPVRGGAWALGGWAGAAWETRTDPELPRRGHRLAWGASAGGVPGGQGWASTSAGATLLRPLGTERLAVAARARGGVARGEIEHRLLGLGGTDALTALPDAAAVGERLGVMNVELRGFPLQARGVPLPLVWGTDLQLGLGAEAGWLGATGSRCPGGEAVCVRHAAAATASVTGLGDVFGARPTLLGVAVGVPWAVSDPALGRVGRPQLTVRLTQPF